MRSRQSAWLTRRLGRETAQDLRGSVFSATQQEKVRFRVFQTRLTNSMEGARQAAQAYVASLRPIREEAQGGQESL